MRILPTVLFRSCAAPFGQIAFLSVKVLKIVTRAWNSLQKGKTVRFSWKLYKTLFSRHAEHVFAKSHLWASKLSKSSHWPQILSKKVKQCAFHKICTKPSFQVMQSTFLPNRICARRSCQNRHTALKFSSKRENSALFLKILPNVLFRSCAARSTFWPNRMFKRQSSQNRHTGLKFSPKRENSALSIKIVQNARFRSCAGGFAQIVFLRVKLLKIVTLVSNSLQNGKTVRFSWNLYKTLFSGHAQHVLAKSHFRASKFLNSSNWPEIVLKTGKLCAFHQNCTKHSFQVMRSTFWPNRFLERQSCQNRYTCLKFSSKRENSALSMKIVQNVLFRSCAARFGQIAFLSI